MEAVRELKRGLLNHLLSNRKILFSRSKLICQKNDEYITIFVDTPNQALKSPPSPCGRGLGGGGDWDETTKSS